VEFSGKHSFEEMREEIKLLPGNLVPLAFNYEANSYIIHERNTKEKILYLKSKLEPKGFFLSGRFAEWEYYNMDKAIEAAMKVNNKILNFNENSDMYFNNDWVVIIPMANEENDFLPFVDLLKMVLDKLESGKVYFVVDNVSKDKTLQLCNEHSKTDKRFETIFAPENRNVVDAYMKGYKVAYEKGHSLIIEMDAGLSHDPRALPMFIRTLNEGHERAFGSRFINGGSNADSSFSRKFRSCFGALLSNLLLGTYMKDMTLGYQGFHREVVGKILGYTLKSKAHFYQTEVRYLLRKKRYMEVPIHYRAPSPSVSQKAIKNSVDTLGYYFIKRLTGNAPSL